MKKISTEVFSDSKVTLFESGDITIARMENNDGSIHVFLMEGNIHFKSPLECLKDKAEDWGIIEKETVKLLNSLESYTNYPNLPAKIQKLYCILLEERKKYLWFSDDVYNELACSGLSYAHIGDDKYIHILNGKYLNDYAYFSPEDYKKGLIIKFPDNIKPEPIIFEEI